MYKIIHWFRIQVILLPVFLLTYSFSTAQDTVLNKYGLWVLGSAAQLNKTIRQSPAKAMIDLKIKVPGIVLDLRYSGTNNFMHSNLYGTVSTTYLRKPAASALVKVQAALRQKGLGLKIFDAYRPYSVTEKMWEPVKDDRYAADPKKGSGHNRGVAVDLTIIRLKTGQELEMGTGFDNFSDTAHHDFQNLPALVLQNRRLLKNLMEVNGFRALDTEWWHYSLPDAKDYELLDIPFSELKRKK